MSYVSQIQLPGSETAYDIIDRTIGISSEVVDGNWQFNLVRNGQGLPDVTNVQKSMVNLDVLLTSTNWDNDSKTQTVTVAGLKANDTVWVTLASSATLEQRQAAAKAQIAGTEQAVNAMTFTCYDTIPEVDIPITLTIAPV